MRLRDTVAPIALAVVLGVGCGGNGNEAPTTTTTTEAPTPPVVPSDVPPTTTGGIPDKIRGPLAGSDTCDALRTLTSSVVKIVRETEENPVPSTEASPPKEEPQPLPDAIAQVTSTFAREFPEIRAAATEENLLIVTDIVSATATAEEVMVDGLTIAEVHDNAAQASLAAQQAYTNNC